MVFSRSRLFAIFLAIAALAAPARADIRAFNAAVQAEDYRAALEEARATWPTIDRSGPETVLIAREFAWIAMLAGEPQQALTWSRFLIDEGRTLNHPDLSPAISRVLHDWVSLSVAPTSQVRQNLMASLNARAMISGRDLISPRAALALNAQAWAAGDFAQAEAAAGLALRFIDEVGAPQSLARFEARRAQAMALFMRTKSPDAYTAIYDVASELIAAAAASPTPATRNRLGQEFFAATAWGDTIYGALSTSQKRQLPDRRNSVGSGRPSMIDMLFPTPGDGTSPRCRLTLASGAQAAGFPYVSRFRDFGGEVIYALDVEANGVLSNPRLLAAAPDPQFAAAAQKVASSWRWKLDGAQPTSCRMPRVHVVTLEFAIGR